MGYVLKEEVVVFKYIDKEKAVWHYLGGQIWGTFPLLQYFTRAIVTYL